MLNKINNSPNFGWHYRMHTKILNAAADSQNLKAGNSYVFHVLQNAVIKPDFDEFFMYNENHFYYPDKKIKSFFDFNGKHNAKYVYLEHLNKFFDALKQKHYTESIDHAGRALHYLQDITQPQHIESGSILKKALDKTMHHEFEMQAYADCDKLIKQHTPVALVQNADFASLFNQTTNLSLQNKIPTRKNKAEWNEIAQNGVNLALDATKRFLEIFISQIK